jgi:hypothetical protein
MATYLQGLYISEPDFNLRELIKYNYVEPHPTEKQRYIATDIGRAVHRADEAAYTRFNQALRQRDAILQGYRNPHKE